MQIDFPFRSMAGAAGDTAATSTSGTSSSRSPHRPRGAGEPAGLRDGAHGAGLRPKQPGGRGGGGVATATEFMVQGGAAALAGDVIQVDAVNVESVDSTLRVVVVYQVRGSEGRLVARFERECEVNIRYFCGRPRRLQALRAHPTLNGIEWLEVLDLHAPAGSPRQRTLLVQLVRPLDGRWTSGRERGDHRGRAGDPGGGGVGARAADAEALLADGLINEAERDLFLERDGAEADDLLVSVPTATGTTPATRCT